MIVHTGLQEYCKDTIFRQIIMDVQWMFIELALISPWISFPLSLSTESTRNGMEALKTLQWTLFKIGVYGINVKPPIAISLGKMTTVTTIHYMKWGLE